MEEETEPFGWMMSIVPVPKKASLIANIGHGAPIIAVTMKIWVLFVKEQMVSKIERLLALAYWNIKLSDDTMEIQNLYGKEVR